MALTRRDIEEQNTFLLLRRDQFRRAGERIAEAFACDPAIERIALFGSLSKPLRKEIPRFHEYRKARVPVWHEVKDVDLAIWMNDVSRLRALQKTRAETLNQLLLEEGIGVAHHQVEVFFLEPGTDRYLGRLCYLKKCPNKKPECLVPGCGDIPFLQQHRNFEFYPEALKEAIILYDRNSTEIMHPSNQS